MKTLISCAYNMDNCCVEVNFSDGSMIAIDTIVVENEIADNMYQRSELDYLIYNAPLEYADLNLERRSRNLFENCNRIQAFGIADNTLPAGENPAGVFLFILFPSVGSQFWKEDDYLKALFPRGSCFQMKI